MSEGTAIININDESFDKVVSEGITIVDFWAPWCLPCLRQGSILKKVFKRIGDRIKVCKLNVDDNQKSAQKFEIISIPTLLIFRDGKVEKKFIGIQDEKTLIEAVT
jgi:thioredoxin 1